MNKIILLSLEISTYLYSFTLSDGKNYFYYEFYEKNIKSENILNFINFLFLKNKNIFKYIDFIAFGSGPANFTNARTILAIISGLTLGWKIPVVKISSFKAIALEAFIIYNNKFNLVAYDSKMEYLCYKLYDIKDLNFDDEKYNITHLKNICLPKRQITGIIHAPNYYLDIITNINPFLNVKKNIFPKSIYIDLLARRKISTGKIDIITKIEPKYIFKIDYKKYQL